MEEDWDTLLVLDACRTDLFEETVDTGEFDTYESKYSAASATNEWCRQNFSCQALTDTVYVTGNPVVSREVRTAFHAFLEPWRTGFDDEQGTVLPEAIADSAIEAIEQYPNKRVIVHFLQPHYPFIDHPELRFADFGQTDEFEPEKVNAGASDVWEAYSLGLVNREEVWSGYRYNLERVMESVWEIIDGSDRRTVVTSDHGNMLGERLPMFFMRLYGHPPGIHHTAIRRVH